MPQQNQKIKFRSGTKIFSEAEKIGDISVCETLCTSLWSEPLLETEVGIYIRKQENKKERKQALDQESKIQEKR